MVDSAHRVISLTESIVSNKGISNYHLAWKLQDPESANQVKYYRIFRSKNKLSSEKVFLGITTSTFYVDKRVEFKYSLIYTVEAISQCQ